MSRIAAMLQTRTLVLAAAVVSASACTGLPVSDAGAPLAQPEPATTVPSPTPAATAASGADAPKPPTAHIYKGSGPLIKQPKFPADPTGGNIQLNFEAADIRDIAKTVLAEILKQSYIVDPKVTGTISFRTTSPLPREALLPTLETILRMNGAVMVKENGIFKIMPAASAKGSLSPRLAGPAAGYTIQVVPLKFVGAEEMAKLLEPFSTDPAAVKTDTMRNLLILSGTQNEIQHMLDTIDVFDVDWLSGMSIGLFTLQNSDVKTLSSEVGKLFGDKAQSPLAGVVRIVPLERLNAFVVITPQPQYLEQARIWLDRLDKAGGTSGTRLYVYQVQNSKADYLADLLGQTFASSKQGATASRTTTPSVAPGLTAGEIRSTGSSPTSTFASSTQRSGALGSAFGVGASNTAAAANSANRVGASAGYTLSISDDGGSAGSEMRVVADRENNSLLILANAAGYDKLESALKKLDVPPRQVLIEVTIAEVTLTDDLEYGVEWAFTKGSRKSGKLDLGSTAGLNQIANGFSYALTNVTGDALKAVFNTLATDNRLNILSSPHIMVADNQTAKIQVGDSVPTQTSSTTALASVTTGTVTSTVQYLDTGIMLSVTPRINAGGLVNLDITQEVSTATETTSSTINSPTISKRAAKTIVTVQNGETMVMGGLMSEESSNGSAGIPFLSQIPILGAAFGKQSRKATKKELILLITPRVANNVVQGKEISDELRRKMDQTKDLVDCGTSNIIGFTTRGGPWCMQARRYDGAIDKMKLEDENGIPVYLKDEAKLEQQEAQRALDEANRKRDEASQRLEEASKRVKATQGTPKEAVPPTLPAKQPAAQPKPAAPVAKAEAVPPTTKPTPTPQPAAPAKPTPTPQPVTAAKPAQPTK